MPLSCVLPILAPSSFAPRLFLSSQSPKLSRQSHGRRLPRLSRPRGYDAKSGGALVFSFIFEPPWRSCRGTYVMPWSCQHEPTSRQQPNLRCSVIAGCVMPSPRIIAQLSSVLTVKRPRHHYGRMWVGSACRCCAGPGTINDGKHVRF